MNSFLKHRIIQIESLVTITLLTNLFKNVSPQRYVSNEKVITENEGFDKSFCKKGIELFGDAGMIASLERETMLINKVNMYLFNVPMFGYDYEFVIFI